MYSTVITFKDNTPGDILISLKETCEKAFDNRAGKAIGRCEKVNTVIFEGDEELYGCLQLGCFALEKIEGFGNGDFVLSWEWLEDDPEECCDVLEIFSKYAS
jgi:hypothetical protein